MLGKLPIATLFGLFAVMQAIAVYKFAANWSAMTMEYKLLHFGSALASFIFVVMIVAMTVVRLRPQRKAPGIQPRLSALFGAFFSMSLVLLPKPTLPPAWQVLSIVLLLVGSALSFCVLSQLGRSFSVMAEARHLVTGGPYAIVRHPLYLCEEIAIVGAMLAHLSPSAVAIVAVQWLFQLKRMAHEERVLRAAFPAYAAYAAATPKLFPRLPWEAPRFKRRRPRRSSKPAQIERRVRLRCDHPSTPGCTPGTEERSATWAAYERVEVRRGSPHTAAAVRGEAKQSGCARRV